MAALPAVQGILLHSKYIITDKSALGGPDFPWEVRSYVFAKPDTSPYYDIQDIFTQIHGPSFRAKKHIDRRNDIWGKLLVLYQPSYKIPDQDDIPLLVTPEGQDDIRPQKKFASLRRTLVIATYMAATGHLYDKRKMWAMWLDGFIKNVLNTDIEVFLKHMSEKSFNYFPRRFCSIGKKAQMQRCSHMKAAFPSTQGSSIAKVLVMLMDARECLSCVCAIRAIFDQFELKAYPGCGGKFRPREVGGRAPYTQIDFYTPLNPQLY